MYKKRSQFEYDVANTISALKAGIKCPASGSDRIISLLEYATNKGSKDGNSKSIK